MNNKLTGKIILIVDDEADYREVLIDEFRSVGASTVEAENGEQAFEIVQNQKIDAIVSDIRMSPGNGMELLRNVKKLKSKPLVFFLITGFSDYSIEEAFDAGAEAVFTKPFELEKLVGSVYYALLPEKEKWIRKFERFSSDFKIELEVESLGQAISGQLLNIGRGGMFIALDKNFPEVEARIAFRVALSFSIPDFFEGKGVCRWVRTNRETGFASGIGVEFSDLTETSLQKLSSLLKDLDPISYIPRR